MNQISGKVGVVFLKKRWWFSRFSLSLHPIRHAIVNKERVGRGVRSISLTNMDRTINRSRVSEGMRSVNPVYVPELFEKLSDSWQEP